MSVRQPQHIGSNIIGCFPSLKTKGVVTFESTIERDLIYFLEYDPTVSHFEAQPCTLKYELNGHRKRYTPDFNVCHGSYESLVECKPVSKVPEFAERFDAIQRLAQWQDKQFVVVTDQQLRTGYYLKNIQHLTYYARFIPPVRFEDQLVKLLQLEGTLSIERIHHVLSMYTLNVVRASVLHLAYHRRVWIDLSAKQFNTFTLVSSLRAASRRELCVRAPMDPWSAPALART